jgi:4-amino-4-deoxy-L-arabinose transferase-like glycosyltransferase
MRLSIDKLMLVGLVIFSLAEGLTHYGQVYPDSPGYVAAAHFFQGRGTATGAAEFRLLRPLVPFVASLANHFVDIRTSFAMMNLVFWCASAVLMFYFTKLITKDTDASLLSSALFTSAIPMLLFADAVLTDMAGYFFILFGVYLVVRWHLPHATLKRVFIAGLVLGVGILARESVAAVLIFALAWAILSRGSITRTIIFCLIPLGISVLWSSAIGVGYLAWYGQGLAFAGVNQHLSLLQRAYRLLGSIQYSFGRYPEVLILAALGLLRIDNKSYLKIHISILIGTLAIIFAWPVIDTRFTFILFPSIFPLAGSGMEEAYNLIFKSKLVQTIWPSFPNNAKSRFAFLLFVLAVCALITNTDSILRGYFSFPWMPYTDPSVKLTDIT